MECNLTERRNTESEVVDMNVIEDSKNFDIAVKIIAIDCFLKP